MIGMTGKISLRRALQPLLLTLLLALTAAEVCAQTPQVPAQIVDRASFQVRVIEATKGAPQTDPKLADLDRELRSLHRDYTRFVLVKSETQNLVAGARGTVRLPNGDLAIQFLGLSADKVQRVRHRVEMPGMNATVRAVAPGGRTIDVLQVGDKLVIIATTVGR
jgi:hypothetical protein